MDAKTIERLGRDLTKASQTDPPSTLLKLLSDLRTGVKASEDLLRSTKIGITVNKLKMHKDTKVAQEASSLVNKWRKDIKDSMVGVKSPGANGAGKAGEKMDVDEKAGVRKNTVPPDKRSAKMDEVDCQVTGQAARDSCLRLIYDGLAIMSEEPPSTLLALATSIEAAAYALHGPETAEPYRAKMRSLFTNLKNKSNPHLRQRITKGEISPDRFVRMTNEELKSPERLAEDQAMQKENMDKAMVAREEKSISGSMVCGKCGQKKVSYSQAQTRSADEPMTTFCECLNCGHRWKFS